MNWNDERPWYNDRIIETIISSDAIDYHGEVIKQDAIYRVLPFLAKHGIYNYWHSNFPIGEIIAWRINDKGLPVIKVGIHDTRHSNIPQHDDVWKEIKMYGTRGQSSIEGVSNSMMQGGGKPNTIEDMGLWAVAWVADGAANKNANVTFVNECAKVAKSIGLIPDNNGSLKVLQEEIMSAIQKERVYVKNPSDVPEGASVRTGERGGHYYESGGGGSGDKKPEGGKTEKPNTENDKPKEMTREDYDYQMMEDTEHAMNTTLQELNGILNNAKLDTETHNKLANLFLYIEGKRSELSSQILSRPESNKKKSKRIGGKQMEPVEKAFPPKKADEEETDPPTTDVKPEETAEQPVPEPPVEEVPAEVPPEVPAPAQEVVPDGLAQQVAALREQVSMLATAVEMLKNGTPSALADAAEAAEVVAEVIEQATIQDKLTGNAMTPEQPDSEMMTMKAELDALKAENEEYKKLVGNAVEKAETPEVKKPEVQALVIEQPKAPEVKPQRRAVETVGNATIPGFDQKEMMDAVNHGKQSEYFREKFKIDRKIAR